MKEEQNDSKPYEKANDISHVDYDDDNSGYEKLYPSGYQLYHPDYEIMEPSPQFKRNNMMPKQENVSW